MIALLIKTQNHIKFTWSGRFVANKCFMRMYMNIAMSTFIITEMSQFV